MPNQSINIRHDILQDRIIVRVRESVSGNVWALYLTRRMICGLLPPLAGLVQRVQQSAISSTSSWQDSQDELLSMQLVSAVTEIRQSQESTLAQSLPTWPENLPHCLPVRVDVSRSNEGITTLSFFSGEQAEERLFFGDRELHWFMERLVHLAQNAGWSEEIPLPDWLSQGTNQVAGAPVTVTLH